MYTDRSISFVVSSDQWALLPTVLHPSTVCRMLLCVAVCGFVCVCVCVCAHTCTRERERERERELRHHSPQ